MNPHDKSYRDINPKPSKGGDAVIGIVLIVLIVLCVYLFAGALDGATTLPR